MCVFLVELLGLGGLIIGWLVGVGGLGWWGSVLMLVDVICLGERWIICGVGCSGLGGVIGCGGFGVVICVLVLCCCLIGFVFDLGVGVLCLVGV